jgi:hypothetical protein
MGDAADDMWDHDYSMSTECQCDEDCPEECNGECGCTVCRDKHMESAFPEEE